MFKLGKLHIFFTIFFLTGNSGYSDAIDGSLLCKVVALKTDAVDMGNYVSKERNTKNARDIAIKFGLYENDEFAFGIYFKKDDFLPSFGGIFSRDIFRHNSLRVNIFEGKIPPANLTNYFLRIEKDNVLMSSPYERLLIKKIKTVNGTEYILEEKVGILKLLQ